MAGRGPAPKMVRARARTTAQREAEMKKVAKDGTLRGPDLPEDEWHPRTLAWWDTWRRSAQAQTFTSTDWDFLIDTAILHTRLWNGEASSAAELRIRAAKFGATPEDRMRLKVQVDEEAEQAPKPATSKARRARILQAVEQSA